MRLRDLLRLRRRHGMQLRQHIPLQRWFMRLHHVLRVHEQPGLQLRHERVVRRQFVRFGVLLWLHRLNVECGWRQQRLQLRRHRHD